MSLRIFDLNAGWKYSLRVHVSGAQGGGQPGRAVRLWIFVHPTTGFDVFTETTTAAAIHAVKGTAAEDPLTPAAHAHAVSLGAL